jgi:hypothetical protein
MNDELKSFVFSRARMSDVMPAIDKIKETKLNCNLLCEKRDEDQSSAESCEVLTVI